MMTQSHWCGSGACLPDSSSNIFWAEWGTVWSCNGVILGCHTRAEYYCNLAWGPLFPPCTMQWEPLGQTGSHSLNVSIHYFCWFLKKCHLFGFPTTLCPYEKLSFWSSQTVLCPLFPVHDLLSSSDPLAWLFSLMGMGSPSDCQSFQLWRLDLLLAPGLITSHYLFMPHLLLSTLGILLLVSALDKRTSHKINCKTMENVNVVENVINASYKTKIELKVIYSLTAQSFFPINSWAGIASWAPWSVNTKQRNLLTIVHI